MRTFNFETNIEKRMVHNGEIFAVDRMTSSYAQAHPLNLDELIENVYNQFADTEFKESREAMRKLWNDVMKDRNPRGDASIYPNINGNRRPALVAIWLKAGDYWRRGFRYGDTLPNMVPLCNITRFDDGEWIALFPKDMNLLEGDSNEETSQRTLTTEGTQESGERNDNTDNLKPETSTPVELDLFAQMLQRAESVALASDRPTLLADSRRQRKQRMPRYEVPAKSVAVAISQPEPMIDMQAILKFLGVLTVVCVVLLAIYSTGLLIPLGLIGLGIGGLLK